jgi:hypothetical protein
MSSIFDSNARADESLMGGEPAARAVGLPTAVGLPGTFAPGGSNATAQGLLEQMQARTQSMMGEATAQPAREPVVGYNPQDNTVFSGGKMFKLDLNEGRQNAPLFDVDNTDLPQGYLPVRSSQVKARLAREYDDLGLVDATQRRAGQAFSNVGSALQDFGAESLGQYMQESGGALAARNPSKITSASDVLDSPLQTATEAVGEVVGYDVPVAIAQTAAGAAAGAKAGTLLAPLTGGASIPIGALLGGIGARYLGSMLETYGSVRAEQREQGIEDKTRAAGAAGASAALEALLGPEARIASQFGKRAAAADQALSGADRTLAAGRLRGAGRDLLVQGGIEGATEVPQSAIERFGAYKDLGSEEAIDEYAVGAAKGFFGGAALGPVTSTIEYQQAQNFVENLKADMALASDPTASGPDRLRAAKRAQDVLRGSSDDPQFDAVLQEFRQKLDFVGTQITSNATRTALAEGAPVNLLDTASGEETDRSFGRFNTQPDLFNRVASAEGSEIEIARRQQDNLDVYNQLQADREVPITQIQPGQQELFGETGAPTYAADPGFGESQFEFNQNVQGPPITPGQRTVAGFPELNATMDQIQSGQIAREGLPVTGELTPGQQAALVPPTRLDPFQRALRGVSLDLDQPATGSTIEPVSKVGGAPATLTPSAPVAEGAFSADDDSVAADIQTALQAADKKPVGRNPLAASVEGAQGVTAPGQRSLTDAQVARITNAAVDLEARGNRLPPKDRGIISALVNFGRTYKSFLDAAGNMQRPGQVIKRGTTAEDAVEGRVDNATNLAQAVKDALAALGVAVGGNAKDVDVLVATIKAASQGKIGTITDPETIKLYKRLDSMISQAWTASKAESFTDNLDDMFYTRQQPTRAAREDKDQTSPLVKAANEGFGNPKGTASAENTYSGFLGVLQYIRFYGTGYERMLARQIREALKNSRNVPKVEFIEKGTPRYDPKNNTIYLRSNESNSVVLHEGLHAALQWFVYQNPNNAAVKQLKTSLKAVVAYNGSLGAKAKEVQDLLKKLVADGNETDAVLELVSYGNTLNDFRKALEAMPRSTTPKTFYEAVQDVWQSALAVIQQLLGNSKTEASAVIQSTWDLLAQVGEGGKAAPKTRKGNVLEAAITDDGTVDVANMTAMQAAQNPAAAPMSTVEFSKYSKKIIPEWVSSKALFDLIGWNKFTSGAGDRAVVKLNNWIQENSPGLTKAVSWVNSHYALPGASKDALVAMLTRSKDLRRGGSGIYEDLANYFTSLPAAQNKVVLQYMDAKLDSLRAKTKAPAFPTDDKKLQLLADATIEGWWAMASAEPDPKLRAAMAGNENPDGTWSGGVNFTRSLVFPANVNQLASRSFGARNINQLVTTRTKKEVNDEAVQFAIDADGDPVLTGNFIGLYKVTPELQSRLDKGESLADINPDEYIAESLYNEGKMQAGYKADPDFSWTLKTKEKDAGFVFTGRLDPLSAKATQDGARLAHALQNTMAIMANSYSANTLANDLVTVGREDGVLNANAVVFDNIDQLNRTLNGDYDADGNFVPETDSSKWSNRVKSDQVYNIASDEAKSETVKGMYRHRKQWVRLPKGPTYGNLGGKIVNGAVWSAIEDMSDRRPLVDSAAYNGTMRWFKAAKTKYNPATWGTNVASNVTMAMMDDIPMATLAQAARLYALYHTAPGRLTPAELDLMVKIKNTNALLGDFSSNEIKKSLYDTMKSSIGENEGGIPERVMQFFKIEKERTEKIKALAGKGADAAEKFDEYASAWYSAQDNVFRVASMLNQLGQAKDAGKSMDAETFRIAGDHARFAFLDYDIDSKAVRIMRQTAFPFISWPYAAAKLIGNIAVHRPWKLVNLYAGYWMIEAVMQAISGDDEEEDEAKRKVGPEWARDRLLFGYGPHASLRVPFMGDDKNPVFYNAGKYMVPSSFGDRTPNGFMGQGWFPSFLIPGGPFISTAVATVGGVDPFNAQPLSPPTASDWEALVARTKYVQSLFVPNLPYINLRETDKLAEAISGRTDKTDSHAELYFARLAGMRFQDYNVDKEQISQFRAAKAIMGQYKQEIGKLRRAEARLETPDWDAFREKQTELLQRMQEEMAKAKGEE